MPITPTQTVNPATMAANWGPGVRNNSAKWLAKYLAPKRLFNADPAGWASAWQQGIDAAIAAGTPQKKFAAADPNVAAQNATQFGQTNFANAGTTKAPKYAAKTAALAALINSGLNAIASLPKGKGANNENRMLTFTRTMAAGKGTI